MPAVSKDPVAATAGGPARRHAALAFGVIALTFGSVGAKRVAARRAPAPTTEQCLALVDRYVERSLVQRDESLRPTELAAAVEKARTTPEHAQDAADCARRLTREQVECAVAAGNVDQLERCLQ